MQLDKKGLAVVYGEFHHYLFVRCFEILSDHKPLQHLFSESHPISVLASARIQRLALTLSAYTYSISYKPRVNNANANADVLSHLPLPEEPTDVPPPGETVLLMETLHELM